MDDDDDSFGMPSGEDDHFGSFHPGGFGSSMHHHGHPGMHSSMMDELDYDSDHGPGGPSGRVGPGPGVLLMRAVRFRSRKDPLTSLKYFMVFIGLLFSLVLALMSAFQLFVNTEEFRFEGEVFTNFLLGGFFTGLMLCPFLLIPLYIWLRTELLQQRTLPAKHPLRGLALGNCGIVLMVVILAIVYKGDFTYSGEWEHYYSYWSTSLGVHVLIFTRSLLTFGVYPFFPRSFLNSNTELEISEVLIAIMTWVFYGLVYKVCKHQGKERTEAIRDYLRKHQEEESISLVAMGQALYMRPLLVKSILLKLQEKGEFRGELRGMTLEQHGPKRKQTREAGLKKQATVVASAAPASAPPPSPAPATSTVARPIQTAGHQPPGQRPPRRQRTLPGKGYSPTLCPNCNRPVEEDWDTCQYCATGLTENFWERRSLRDEIQN